ncbi:hypothetical protein G7Y89_g1262 [Cudoniella acicularis]|uniref:Uncharacterized protein n=1 Tax=Cudoniella acicularis TaxID=354080 RepID=A0A8H4RVL7_9HELO|nr:hypothetical protein G7Y89_g1262 [Cudoniella acicularis]
MASGVGGKDSLEDELGDEGSEGKDDLIDETIRIVLIDNLGRGREGFGTSQEKQQDFGKGLTCSISDKVPPCCIRNIGSLGHSLRNRDLVFCPVYFQGLFDRLLDRSVGSYAVA